MMGLRSLKYGLLLALIPLVTAGCGPRITIHQVEPVEQVLQTETRRLSNCDCETELVSAVDCLKLSKIDDFGTRSSKQDNILIPADLMAELEAELELVYGPLYEIAQAEAGAIQLTVPPDKIRAYKIEWLQQTYSSTISFHMGWRTYTTTYSYQLKLPKESDFVEIDCTP